MSSFDKTVVILGGARDFHAIDWYRTVIRICPQREVVFITDLFGGEGYIDLSKPEDKIFSLFVLDKYLFSRQFRGSNIWRNLIKLIFLPIQAIKLRRILNNFPDYIVHAHPMYYMAVCLFAGVEYIGTPQGSEILVRPVRSRIYRFFAKKVLRSARVLTVDSQQMKDGIQSIAGVNAHIFQNGINIDEIKKYDAQKKRERVVSIRGIDELYRISDIIESRNKNSSLVPLTFIYPFADASYIASLRRLFDVHDQDLGRLEKDQMYSLLSESLLVISIPRSDSSPRSVYESIFAGACVAVTYNKWIDVLPPCMRSRVFVVELSDDQWFSKAISYAQQIVNTPFIASKEAIELYDENVSIGKVIEQLYC